jgi:alpha-N-arabinofuranosidase
VSYLDIAGVHDGDAGTLTFFAVNRHGGEPITIDLSLERFGSARSVEHTIIKHQDLEATNTRHNPNNVGPRKTDDAILEGNAVHLTVPPHSYSMIRVQL